MAMRIENHYPNKAVFLDRDGTLNRETGYLHDWREWEWLPGVKDGLTRLAKAGYLLVIVSNQSGIAKGLYTEQSWHKIARHINEDLLPYGIKIDGFYFCPHHPDLTGACECRKPAPGMLLKAAKDLKINLSVSWMIGDKASDIKAALAAGCSPILIETGYGMTEKNLLSEAIPVCDNFSAAVSRILQNDIKPY